jgi:predicted alpha/beta superfamily hydrolase
MMRINLTQYENLKHKDLLPRDVWVWTPPQYEQDSNAHFPVIYMHDAQNLFYPEKSYTHVTWGVAEAISRLSYWGFIRPAIVVGIDNTSNRVGDYLPSRPFESPEGKAFIAQLEAEAQGELEKFDYVADYYLEWLVAEIKPLVDADFQTLADTEHTFMMGSSMGGLISLYALVEYPQVFGGAGCFSPHWPILGPLTVPYLQKNLPEAGQHKVYFDYGTVGLDAEYAPFQDAVDQVMQQKGYRFGEDWLTRVAPGADHHERAWRNRMHVALRFFLGN